MKGDVLKAKDYRTDLQPVWCTGCGDFGVLKGLTQALADLQIEPEKLAVISGIGCSSRLPGYVKAYSFNSIHGRALPIATGLKTARPELTTIVVGGDGDGFSIGLGHIPHAIRRNTNLTYIVMDNGIYGLTKGQASPTTEMDSKRSRGLAGADDQPLNPVMLVLSAGCGFVARTHAGNMPHMRGIFREAVEYSGFSFVHVLAGCVTYQPRGYADQLLQRSYELPAGHDATNQDQAMASARDGRFALGVLYRRPVTPSSPVAAGPSEGDWSPADDILKQDLPSE
jgi:2-oxoglutarate ferredoxin oxidoreductase subunit beta